MNEARPRAVEEVARRVRESILRGEYAVGADLPGERALAVSLGVSRLTLRAGLSRLEAEGLVRPVHGSGTRVLDYRETGGIEVMAHLVALGAGGTASALSTLGDLLELRRVLAAEAVGFAAERALADEVDALDARLDAMDALVDDPPAWIAADLAFARAVARTAHNAALVLVTNTLSRMLEQQPGVEAAFMADPRATLTFYRRALALVRDRDAERARALTRRLLARLDRRVLDTLRSALAPETTP